MANDMEISAGDRTKLGEVSSRLLSAGVFIILLRVCLTH